MAMHIAASSSPSSPLHPAAIAPVACAASAAMKLDLFMLTFNCAKVAVDVGVFATHLHTALIDQATQLPELVVLSLQEVAPLPNAFVGGALLDPYLVRFEEAVNLAALNARTILANASSAPESAADTDTLHSSDRPYSLVKAHNVGMTAIMLFVRAPAVLGPVSVAEVGFGAADMGNKGAVGLRTMFSRAGCPEEATELTFVAAHLAAMEWNVAKRNANWYSVMRALTFQDPDTVVRQLGHRHAEAESESGAGSSAEADDDGENISLLATRHREARALLDARLHDLSVFKPSSHLFFGGDLNYRIATSSPPPNAVFPSSDPASPHHYDKFLPLDQLTQERHAGRCLHGMSEAPIGFAPTYKYKALPRVAPPDAVEMEVPSTYARHRYPSWTDRILFLDTPPWLKQNKTQASTELDMEVHRYTSLPLMRCSDHQPVYLRISVPLIAPARLAPPQRAVHENALAAQNDGPADADADVPAEWRKDPRAQLPVGIDPEAWQRRRTGRWREWVVGWGSAVWSTRQGALVLASALAVAAVTYYAVHAMWAEEAVVVSSVAE
ncbi:hypothetical protein TD95_001339 [Thielaviopsis punctulata]|uniref:Inositol polyphosphate-related phosphatase domain-containing protein n=1 Tax=Thielaviopsis punctulata TaxID=72032 RepID=A0A0F4ZKB4_9PEZI|nr:hypothetical protein TD95_001339 [Thielaviopsis punctulata]